MVWYIYSNWNVCTLPILHGPAQKPSMWGLHSSFLRNESLLNAYSTLYFSYRTYILLLFWTFFQFLSCKKFVILKKMFIYRKLTRIVKLPIFVTFVSNVSKFCHIFLLSVHIHTHFLILFLLTHLRANCRHHDFTLKCFSTYLLWTRIFSLKYLFYFIWTFLKTSSIQLSDWENLKLIQCYYLHSAIISPYSNSVLLVPSIL